MSQYTVPIAAAAADLVVFVVVVAVVVADGEDTFPCRYGSLSCASLSGSHPPLVFDPDRSATEDFQVYTSEDPEA